MVFWPQIGAWYMVAIAVLPLMNGAQKVRTWCALFAAGLSSLVIPPDMIIGFLLADFLAGAIIITHPAGLAQRTIGALFLAMVFFHVGFILSQLTSYNVNGHLYGQANRFVGWLQLACLSGWGMYDAGKAIRGNMRPVRNPLVANTAATP